jgi:serine/threonine-protein kinase
VRDEESPVDQLETLAGTVFGTPRYLSPEQAQGVPLDARSDLYSLGVLMFQMLAGRAPFVDDDAVVVMAKHIKNAPPELNEAAPGIDIPAAVESVVRRTLEKLPENRPATAEQMLNELEHALSASRAVESGVRLHVAEEDLPESLRLAERRTWLLGGLLAASLLAVVALGLAVWARPLQRWSGANGTGASFTRIADPPAAASVTTALQPTTPTVATTGDSASGPENSASIAAPSASVAESTMKDATLPAASLLHPLHTPVPGVPSKKPAPKTTPASPLERRGNERYGRFD